MNFFGWNQTPQAPAAVIFQTPHDAQAPVVVMHQPTTYATPPPASVYMVGNPQHTSTRDWADRIEKTEEKIDDACCLIHEIISCCDSFNN